MPIGLGGAFGYEVGAEKRLGNKQDAVEAKLAVNQARIYKQPDHGLHVQAAPNDLSGQPGLT